MLKYIQIANEETKLVNVNTNDEMTPEEAVSLGLSEEKQEVEQAWNGDWYLVGYAPEKPIPTKEEIAQKRRQLYIEQKDPITCQIQALKDEEQTEEVVAEIEALKVERAEIVAKIKEENPYPTEE